jgi:hypothetical protein
METVTLESIPIVVGREDDGRWWADVESMPGVMAYGATRESAVAAVRACLTRCRGLHRSRRRSSRTVCQGLLRGMSRWKSVKAKQLLAALLRIGWEVAGRADLTAG